MALKRADICEHDSLRALAHRAAALFRWQLLSLTVLLACGRASEGSNSGAGAAGADSAVSGSSGASGETDEGAGEGGASGNAAAGASGADDAGAAGTIEAGLASLTEVVQAYCETAAHCCSDPALADCANSVPHYLPIEAVERGAVRIDEAQAEACRAALEASQDSCQAPPSHVCEGIYVPRRQPGEACAEGHDCALANHGAACLFDAPQSPNEAPPGVCQTTLRASKGQACVATCPAGRDCWISAYDTDTSQPASVCLGSDGLYCDTTEQPSTCKRFAAEGEYCASQAACGPSADCYYDCYPGTQHCSTYCMPKANCDGVDCAAGEACVNGKCKTKKFAQAIGCSPELVFSASQGAFGW